MIELKNCMKKYKKGKVGIENVNICLPKNGFIGIYGKSGSGKSTLINCLGGLDKFTSGEIYLDNILVKNLRIVCVRKFCKVLDLAPPNKAAITTKLIKNPSTTKLNIAGRSIKYWYLNINTTPV